MVFEEISFIKPNRLFEASFHKENFAPLFRKKIKIRRTGSAKLYVCGLGYGYYYINGQQVSSDLFTAPVSNYNKTLWYNVYDVSHLLQKGENIIAVICGNGWYNEDCPSPWEYDKAEWRDLPKFILRLDIDGKTVAVSDDTWKCKPDSAIWFNALRNGEYFDARKYEENWVSLDYDDSLWEKVVIDKKPPKGVFRECYCEPIREDVVFTPREIIKTGTNKFIYDFGQNISGYARIHVTGNSGDLLVIRYAEQIKSDYSRELNKMERNYPESEFQTDKFICSGREMVWSPQFTYHGFRFIEIEGLTDENAIEICAVFVHQAVEKRTQFECSDDLLNKLFHAGQISTLSNMFYMITDCPTREKLGWTNDAQASAEQILTDFKAERLLEKWLTDIQDAMREDGSLPGIIPTAGWGYEWGNGPVSDGVLFEIPYRIYLHTGNKKPLIDSFPWFERYLSFLKRRTDSDGFIRFGLSDWANPGFLADWEHPNIPVELVNAAHVYQFYHIAGLTVRLMEMGTTHNERADYEHDAGYYKAEAIRVKELVIKTYVNGEGKCTVNKQTAVALLIYYGLYEKLEPLKRQLIHLIEENEFHHDCGMVGLRRLYMALNKCGMEDYAYQVINADGYPGYRAWFEQGATTLWEYWDYEEASDSKNHHMYSDVMSWMVKTILGIKPDINLPGFKEVHIEPYFLNALNYAKGNCDTVNGRISVYWEKKGDKVFVEIEVPENMTVYYRGKKLLVGKNEITEPYMEKIDRKEQG